MLMKTRPIYHEASSPQADRPVITGRNLANARRNTVERALLAADLHLDRVTLTGPTIKQSAALAGICVPYAAAAVAIADDPAARAAALAGKITILDAAKAAARETLADHFARATQAEWLEAARVIGPAVIWDRMIAPVV